MLSEVGRIVALESDSVWVETIRRSTCGTCQAQKGCGHGILNSIGDGRRSFVRVLPGKVQLRDCQVDDSVRISIPEAVLLRGSLIVYLLPLLCMLAGALLAVNFGTGTEDVLAALGAIAGLVAGFAIVRWHGLRHRNDASYQPVLVEVLESRAEPLHLT